MRHITSSSVVSALSRGIGSSKPAASGYSWSRGSKRNARPFPREKAGCQRETPSNAFQAAKAEVRAKTSWALFTGTATYTAAGADSIEPTSAILRCELYRTSVLFPLDGVGSAVPSLQLHPVFGIDTERVPPNDAMSRFVGFGDKSWDNLKNFFQTQGFEFLFLSQSARRVAFGGSMAPKTPVLKLNRPFARKPPAAIASELTRVACAPFAKPQVAGLRHS